MTAYGIYTKNFAQAEQIEIQVDVVDLLVNEIKIEKIEIQQTTLLVYTKARALTAIYYFK
jgi:uncharacterized protein involved in outer membrane biogenesis